MSSSVDLCKKMDSTERPRQRVAPMVYRSMLAAGLVVLVMVGFMPVVRLAPAAQTESPQEQNDEKLSVANWGVAHQVEVVHNYQSKLDRHRLELANLEKQSQRVRDEMDEMRHRVRQFGFSLESVQPNTIELEQRLVQLAIDLAGKQARHRAILKQVEQIQVEIERQVAKDKVLERLNALKRIELQKFSQLERLAERGLASQADRTKAEASLAEVQIRIAERKSKVAATGSGQSMAAIRFELFTLSMDIAELEAQRTFIEDQLKKLHQAVDWVHQHERTRATRLEHLDRQMQMLLNESTKLERRLNEEMHQLQRMKRDKRDGTQPASPRDNAA